MRRNKILVVEDNPVQLKIIATILQKEGYEVIPKLNGLLALEEFEKIAPDIILLDINMPGLSGVEVCRKIKENPANLDTPVLFLTSYKEPELMLEAFSVGAIDYISKPFNRDEILARVKAQIKYRELADEKVELTKALDRSANERMIAQLSIGLAHNFNNMLTSAMGYCQLIEATTKEEESRKRISVVRKVMQDMHRMISNLVDFSDRGSSHSEKIPLVSFLDERAKAMASTSFPDMKIEFHTALPDDSVYFKIDTKNLTICIYNILKNSSENSRGKETKVKIELTKSKLPEEIKKQNSGPNMNDEFYCIRFIDNGLGLGNIEHPEEIFQPFWTTKKTVGVGLGLSVVHGFVTRMQGYTNAKNNPDSGAIIELYIPTEER